MGKEAPEYVVSACGHGFHKACLYSYLTEPSELNFTTCDKCELVRAYVRMQEWDALVVEVAMDRLKKVALGELSAREHANEPSRPDMYAKATYLYDTLQ